MKKNAQKTQDAIKIGKTVFIINHVFESKQTKQEMWISIITRAESLKIAKN